MKKHAALALLTGLVFASCKKEYTCECTNVITSTNESSTKTYTFESRKIGAEGTCKDYEQEIGVVDVSFYEPSTNTCNLK
jgi:hypothetical protein